jgi:TfoX/Sxy family transcriptional regulator of competence genes
MASSQSTVDFILEQIARAGAVSAKKMFGEYGIYCGGKMVALVCDDKLFVKPTAAGAKFVGPCAEGSPYPGAKPCLLIPEEKWDDSKWLSQVIQLTSSELPLPKKKPSRAKKKAEPSR